MSKPGVFEVPPLLQGTWPNWRDPRAGSLQGESYNCSSLALWETRLRASSGCWETFFVPRVHEVR